MVDRKLKGYLAIGSAVIKRLVLLSAALVLSVGFSFAAVESNKMVSLEIDSADAGPTLRIVTEKPVGYRYTVYDSIDPVRVVVDFPGMDVEGVASLENVALSPVSRVDVSSVGLTSGQLGRVEIILGDIADYDVAIRDNEFVLSLASKDAVTVSEQVVDEPEVVAAAESAAAMTNEYQETAEESLPEPEPVMEVSAAPAKKVTDVVIRPQAVTLVADGHVEIFKFFSLSGPTRLVVDVYGVKAGFGQRSFKLNDDFKKIRVGAKKDRVRFVFDAAGKLPEYSVTGSGNDVVVSWGEGSSSLMDMAGAPSAPQVMGGGPVVVQSVDFAVEDGVSVFRVKTNGMPQLIEPSQKDGMIGFGVRDATISRTLRRAIDASSFPSAIRIITPYTVQVGEKQDVRFAVELKGPTTYSVEKEDGQIVLKVVNGPFAEPAPISPEQVAVEMPGAAGAAAPMDSSLSQGQPNVIADAGLDGMQSAISTSTVEQGSDFANVGQSIGQEMAQQYSGQRISLVFDNADIRNILQLIAEVSELNILAGDGVEGTITLRLIDVPWDQALDLILETKDLGMVRQGNVARILPREAIRTMEESKYTAARTKEKLEDLVTEVIKISYTDLKNVTAPVKNLLTERGKVTEDARNKQLIVNDIPKVIESAKELAAILDTPERQVLIEARIVEVSTTANLDLGINWDIYHNQNPAGTPNMEGEIGLGGNFVIPPFAAGTGQAAGIGTGFTWGAIGVDSTILDLRLAAVETAGEGRVVSNPRILTLNGEKAKISQGTMIPYQTVSSDEIKTDLVEAALSLEVAPVINPDNSIILKVLATNSTPGTTVATGAGAAPSIDKKEAETKMLVQDGDTMVIGGIYVEKDDYSENGVPILMHIPLIGNLFKSQKTNKNRAELMIFITPRIVE